MTELSEYKTYVWELPTIDQKKIALVKLIELYYEFESTGGHLHVLLDDANYSSNIDSFRKDCNESNDIIGLMLCDLLEGMSEEDQEQVVERSWEIRSEYLFD